MQILIAANCLWYVNYYFILHTSDDTRQQQNNGPQMSPRGVLIGKKTKGNDRITDRDFYSPLLYDEAPHLHKCIQAFTHHYFLILSSVWAWLDTFLLCVASSHNHLMLSDSHTHMAICVCRLVQNIGEPRLMERQNEGERMSSLIQAISAKTKQTRRVKIILSGW